MSPRDFAPFAPTIFSFTALIFCLLGTVSAQVLTPPLTTAPPSRSYDPRELYTLLEAQNAATPIAGTRPAPAAKRPSDAELTARVIKLIQQKIDPPSWRDNGGSFGSFETAPDGKLVVIQKPENLEALDALLRESKIQITVETRFVTGGVLLERMEKRTEDWAQRDDAKVWREFLDDVQVDEIVRDLQTQQKSTTLTAPRLTLFNQQQAFVAVATDTAYVATIKEQADGSLDPQVEVFSSGVILDCRCVVRPDHQSLTVELHPKLSRLLSIEAAPWPAPPAERKAFIQIPHAMIAEVQQTFDIPSGKSLLLRLTPKITPRGAKVDAHDELPIFVFVRPTIITPQEN